jgi:hypothetical protein
MRGLLASVGIFLDDKPAAPQPAPEPTVVPVDRDEIRAMLVDRGAPARDLDWLTASCPDLAEALLFEPTPWMLRDFSDHMETDR